MTREWTAQIVHKGKKVNPRMQSKLMKMKGEHAEQIERSEN